MMYLPPRAAARRPGPREAAPGSSPHRPGALCPGPVPLAAGEQSFAEVRALLSEALGEPVRYEQIAIGEVKRMAETGAAAAERASAGGSRNSSTVSAAAS